MSSSNRKHIDVRFHFLREVVGTGDLSVKGTQGLIRPLVPGLKVTLISRCFIGTET